MSDNFASEDSDTVNEPERRFINDRWLCLNSDNNFLEYVDDEWKLIESTEELIQNWELASRNKVAASTSADDPIKYVVDGTELIWNKASQQWLPNVDVNDDFLAMYHANYGVSYDYSQIATPSNNNPKLEEKPLTKEEKRIKKLELEKQQNIQGWIDIDENKNTNVYVSGLPSTINEEEFIELMSKCGVIMKDPRNGKPKIKLYKTESGEPKGDGTCCYIKMESVELALQILDGWELNKHKITVERAKFELKGKFDPKKKKRKLTAAQKKKFFESQQRIFEWKPEKPRSYRPISDCTVVLKNMFTLKEIDENTALILDLKTEVQQLCERFGLVKKVVLHDSNSEGVICVTFESVEHSDTAVKMLDRRLVMGKVISASLWNGKDKFKREETEEERKRRDEAWQRFLGVEDDEKEETEE